MLNIGKWFGYTYENKTAIIKTGTTLMSPDEYIIVEIRNPSNKKPDAYKSINASSVRVLKQVPPI
jgi:hypothetical protein